MSEENKALDRKFFCMFEIGDPGMADEIVAAGYTNHDAPDPNLGSEGVKAAVTMFKQAFPDARNKIAFQLTEGDKVASRYNWSGTHQGEHYGLRATGKRVKWTAAATFRIVDGKIPETWLNYDRLGMMQQLGVA
jgi:predicted ester cyclase